MWSKNKGLSDKELYDILMQSSDDECDKELPLEQAFSDFSSDEDLSDGEAEIHEGSLSFHELEEEEVQLPDQLEGETLRNRQSYDVDNRTWYTVAPKTGKSRSCNILQEDKGLTNRSKDVNSITDCFKLFFSENMLDIIIKYTNKKANDFIKTYNECHEDKLETWIEVDTTEMLAFLGVLILAGRFREAKESVRNLWSTTNNAFTRPIYQATMSKNRFSDILRHLRFDDLSTRAERKEQDKLAPIREITDIFAKNCRESYKPSAFGTIDEQLVTFRGRCSFKVYIPSKPGKYGIKVWAFCDADNYYCCNFEVYLGKLNGIAEKNQGPRVVKTLASHWYGSGRNITTDNFFTDITLAEELLSQNLTIVGTIRKTRKDLPKSLLDIRERATYSSQFLFTRNLTLVSYVTKPNKFVVLLSSMHHEHDIAGEDLKFKPSIITSYNETKSGVDCLDKIVREYSSKRISRRWPLRLFYNWLDIASYNAFVIWILKNPQWKSSNGNLKVRRKLFLEELGDMLTHNHIVRRAEKIYEDGRGFSATVCHAIESTGVSIKKKLPTPNIGAKRSRCFQCRGNDNKYSTKCDKCHKYVCPLHAEIKIQKAVVCSCCSKDEDGE